VLVLLSLFFTSTFGKKKHKGGVVLRDHGSFGLRAQTPGALLGIVIRPGAHEEEARLLIPRK
jgi:hypothetical protein